MVIFMYVICTYDVKSKHCSTFMKLLRIYLFHVQNSVFEGELTPAQYKKLNGELQKIVTEEDDILLFYTYNNKMIKREEIGNTRKRIDIII